MCEAGTLLIYNYAMDTLDPLFSHQYEAVCALSKHFDKITVFTAKVGVCPAIPNTTVISTGWIKGEGIRNILRLIKISLPTVIRRRYKAVFFHMTDVQAAILSPVIRLLRKHQILWYAHTHKSLFLQWASTWVDYIGTSTPGSCPIISTKVVPIGQAINSEAFTFRSLKGKSLSRLIHIGRFDESKRIDYLIESAITLRKSYGDVTLALVGSPASDRALAWATQVKSNYELEVSAGWLAFSKSIPRELFPEVTARCDVFFHAFQGSLDKSILEATMLGMPVVSENPQYLSIFGSWGNLNGLSLESEYSALRDMSFSALGTELRRRATLVVDSHSLENWAEKLCYVLVELNKWEKVRER